VHPYYHPDGKLTAQRHPYPHSWPDGGVARFIGKQPTNGGGKGNVGVSEFAHDAGKLLNLGAKLSAKNLN
jgi:hypothetical protein